MMIYAHADEATVDVLALPGPLFDYLDDQEQLGGHMEKPSMMMMGGRMTYQFDAGHGRAVGSVIKMGGSFMGLSLAVDEIVTKREPPQRKVWETLGSPRILVMSAYRMGFEIAPGSEASRLRVFIEYNRPTTPVGRILGEVFAPVYARWCVTRMADDAARRFARLPPTVSNWSVN